MNIVMSAIMILMLSIGYSPKEKSYPLRKHGIRDSMIENVIVIHYDAGTTATASLKYLKRSGKSYHYMIMRDGTIYKLVDPKYIAYHAGISEWNGYANLNLFSIGICFENTGNMLFTNKQYLSGAWLIRKLRARYGEIPDSNIIGHEAIAYPTGRKDDPGPNFNWSMLYYLADNGFPDNNLQGT